MSGFLNNKLVLSGGITTIIGSDLTLNSLSQTHIIMDVTGADRSITIPAPLDKSQLLILSVLDTSVFSVIVQTTNTSLTSHIKIDPSQTLTLVACGSVWGLSANSNIQEAISLTFSSGLTNTTNTITNDLITGKALGQTVIGGTAASENLVLESTANGTKGYIYLGVSTTKRFVYDELNNTATLLDTSNDYLRQTFNSLVYHDSSQTYSKTIDFATNVPTANRTYYLQDKSGTLALTADTNTIVPFTVTSDVNGTLTNIIPAKNSLQTIIIENTTANAVDIKIGTTAGASDISGGTISITANQLKQINVNDIYSTSTTQTVYISSTGWNSTSLTVNVNYIKTVA